MNVQIMLLRDRITLTWAARSWTALAAAAILAACLVPDIQAQNPPPNDNLTNAQGIIGVSGSVAGTNLYATAQPNEPAPYPGNPAAASIWYLWTAPVNTTIDFNTRGSTDQYGDSLPTALAVYRLTAGTDIAFNNLTLVAQNEDDPSGNQVTSRVDFPATLGTLYLIQVDGQGSGSGNAEGYITLNWAPSLVAGTFQFTTSVFPMGAFDDGFLVQPPADLSPSIHNKQGAPNARITVTRTGGYTGRCEMYLNVTNSFYTNYFFTNITGTNIFSTNYDVLGDVEGFTNTLYTNTAVEISYANDFMGIITYFSTFIDFSNIVVDSSLGVTESFGEGFITNLDVFPCVTPSPRIGRVVYVTSVVNGVTNVISYQTNAFCYTTFGIEVVPSAIDGQDYLSTDSTNITFDDYQMSQDIYLTLPGYDFVDGLSPGPQFPEFYGANADVSLQLENVTLDPLEDPDILPPVISPTLGNSVMNVLTITGTPFNPILTNVPEAFGYATLNLERQTFRVNKPSPTNDVVTNTVWVIRYPDPWPTGSEIQYTIDTLPEFINELTLDWNEFPAVAGSDYANPSTNGLPDYDFAVTYTGVSGSLHFAGDAYAGPQPIYIVVTNNGAQEFDSDLYIQLYETAEEAMANHPPMAPTPTFLGNLQNSTFTINFSNPNPGVQPGGAWDRTFNPDFQTNSFPPENSLPGANKPVQAVAIQANGLPIIGGDFTGYDSIAPVDYVARLNSFGYLDTNFNDNLGSGPNGSVNAIAIDSSGRIYIGGQFTSVNGASAFHIARLLPSGGLDANFATQNGFNSTVYALAIDANGNILAGGDFTSYNANTFCSHIARLLPSGSLDTSFLPSKGTPNSGTDQDVRAIATDAFGNVILGGDFAYIQGTNWNHIARLMSNGVLDPTFNPGVGSDNSVYALAVQPNNSIILGGAFANYNLTSRGSIARLTYNGALDPTFVPGAGANGVVYSVILQTNGTIYIGGQFTSYNTTRRLGIARLLNNGWLDTSFLDTAYNQFAGFINHYYNVYAVNPNDAPAQNNQINIVSAIGVDNAGNVIAGGNFVRVGGGYTRDQIRFQHNVTRLIGAPTPGPETGGYGNCPGNIGLTLNPYTVDDTAGSLYVSLNRVNGSLGPVNLSLGTNTLAPGPGAATAADFGLSVPSATYLGPWNFGIVGPAGVYGWRVSDGYYGLNYGLGAQLGADGGGGDLYLTIHNDTNTLQNLNASLSLLNVSSFGLMSLGGQTIPTGPALGQPTAGLVIVNDNYSAGTLGFGATNYLTVDTAGTVTLTVLRTNGSTGPVSVNYTCVKGFTNGAGTNVAIPGNTPTSGDFYPATGTLNFIGGQTSATITVTIFDHSTMQPTKFFNAVLSAPTGGATLDTSTPPLVPSTTVVEIIDGNFQPGHLEFSSPGYAVLKGSTATITVNRVGGAKGDLTVQCGTANGTAVNGINYTGVTNLLSWGNGVVTPQTMTIQTLQDGIVEGAKTVNLSLFSPNVVGSTGGLTNQQVLSYPSNAVLTIEDIDSYGDLNFSSPSFSVLQTGGQALITVVRTGGLIGSVSVNYATFNGTNAQAPNLPAYAGKNYSSESGTLQFLPGASSASFTVPVYYTQLESNVANRIVTLELFGGSPSIASQFPKTASLVILDPQLVLSPAGSVDQTTLNGLGFNGDVLSLALQPDDSLLAGGDFTFFNDFPMNYVGRLNPDASFDGTFLNSLSGPNGPVTQVISQTPGSNQIDGPIMIVGNFTQVNGTSRNNVARLNLDGSLDETFNPGAGADSTVFGIAEQFLPAPVTNEPPELFYVLGGNFANIDGYPSSGLARVTETGQLDPTFDLGAGVSGSNGTVRVVAVTPANQIIVAGDFTSFDNEQHDHLVRLNVDGSLDTNFAAFNGGGSDINGTVRAVAIQPDGRILIGGFFTTVDGSNYNNIARLNTDGSLDTNFNAGVGCNNGVLALAVDSQTRILVGGEFTQASGVTRNAITRLNPDGTVDPTINFGFGANGYIDSIVLETNGEIDVAGQFTTFNNIPENNFARLYGGANSGDGLLQFSQQTYGALDSASNAVITIERLGGEGTLAQPTVSVEFFTSDSATAVSGRNYVSVTTNVVFPYGETFRTVTVPILYVASVAQNAVVNLNLTNVEFAGIGPQAGANLVITNVNTGVAFSAVSYRQSASAPSGEAEIPIVRLGNPNSTFTVNVYTGTSGTATPNTNYVPTSTNITFTPGILTNYFLVPILNSASQFGDLTVDLEMSNPTNAIISAPSSALLTIASVQNAPGVLFFSETNYDVSEGATNAVITILRTNGTEGNVSVTLTTSSLTATNGLNYTAVSTSVNIAEGRTYQTVDIPVIQQTAAGPNVTVLLTLSNPQGQALIGGSGQAVLTIEDDLQFFSFGSPSYFVNEGAGTVTISILRGGPATNTATVSYTTFSPPGADDTNGFAVPNVDYRPTSGTLRFASEQTLETIPVTIIQGHSVNSVESFEVLLDDPSGGAQVGYPAVTQVGIISDVTGFAFSANTYYVGENGSNVVITINRINPNTGSVSVRYATSDNTAVNGVDYVSTNGGIVFQNGQGSTNIMVQILNPDMVEASKSFDVLLLEPSTNSYLVQPSNAVVIITNVNTGISFGSPSFSVSECGVAAVIPVILTGVTNGPASVDYSTADDSGVEGVNYISTNGTLHFKPGQTVQTFSVYVIDNLVIGPNHTVQLNLSNAVGAQLSNPSSAILTIDECNGPFIVASGTAFVKGNINPNTGVIYSNETVTIDFGLRDIAGGDTTNLVATLLETNGIADVQSSKKYGQLIEYGPTKSEPFTFTAVGSNGQNIIATFTLQDGSRNLSNVAFGLTIGGPTLTFTNPQPVTFAGGTNGTEPLPTRATNSFPPGYGYPSLINVSGVAGTVTAIGVTLTNFGHTFPENVNVVLEDPQGADSIVMSHCGWTNIVQHVTLTFDETATEYAPTNSALVTGSYLPTVNLYDFAMTTLPTVPTGEPFTAPAGPYTANFGLFTGAVANGNWALWIDDDDTLDSGYVDNGWILSLSIGTRVENDADLQVTFAPSTTNASVSNTLTYLMTLTNFGPSIATNVTVTNSIPPGMTYVTNTCDCGAVLTNGILTFTYPILEVGQGVAVGIVLVPTQLGFATNILGAFSDQPNVNSNNIITNVVLVSPAEADVGIVMSETPDPLLGGGYLAYTVVVTNNGPSDATGVSAVISLPAGFPVTSISPSGSASNIDGTITWNIGTLGVSPAKSSATLTVGAQALAGGTQLASATVSSAVYDPTKVNNYSSVKTEVTLPQITVTGSGTSYTLTWPDTASSYVLEGAFELPPAGTWVPITNPPPTVVSGQYTYTLPGTAAYRFYRLATQLP
jgi:uncharacterized delta-60 repeat protein/uncharacterized repeat protein (TIGR01451 family)